MRRVPHDPGGKEVHVDALELVRSRNRLDIELPESGFGATVAAVDLMDCIMAGGIPRDVLDELAELEKAAKAKQDGDGDETLSVAVETSEEEDLEVTWDEVITNAKVNFELARRGLKRLAPSLAELEGTPEVDMPLEVLKELPKVDRELILAYAKGRKDIPKAGAPE
jgi:hypothetical protein